MESPKDLWLRKGNSTLCQANLKVAVQLDSGNSAVAVARVLLVDRPEFFAGSSLFIKNGTGDRDDFFFAVHGILEQSRTPGVAADNSARNEDCGSGELTGEVVQQVVGLKSTVEDEARKLDNFLVGVSGLEITNKESVGTGNGDIVLQGLEDLLFHFENVLLGVSLITDVDEVAEFRRVDLFVLGSNQKTSDTDQLKARTGDLFLLKETVNKVDGQVERFRHELEFQMDLDEPVDQDGAHAFVDVRLVFHVKRADRGEDFLLARVNVHIVNIRGGAERVVTVTFVNVVRSTRHLVRSGVGLDSSTKERSFLANLFHGIAIVNHAIGECALTGCNAGATSHRAAGPHGARLDTRASLGNLGALATAIASRSIGDILMRKKEN